jgi:hypothetical protein
VLKTQAEEVTGHYSPVLKNKTLYIHTYKALSKLARLCKL